MDVSMSPKATPPSGEISLPSFRDGIMFAVRPLNFGGVKAMLSAEKRGPGDMVSVMVTETLKREFLNVTEKEVDNLEQTDFIKLLELVTDANKGLSEADFTPPTSTGS
jgi:hypothetical protein